MRIHFRRNRLVISASWTRCLISNTNDKCLHVSPTWLGREKIIIDERGDCDTYGNDGRSIRLSSSMTRKKNSASAPSKPQVLHLSNNFHMGKYSHIITSVSYYWPETDPL